MSTRLQADARDQSQCCWSNATARIAAAEVYEVEYAFFIELIRIVELTGNGAAAV